MRFPPSRRLYDTSKMITDENSYIDGLNSRQEYLKNIEDCMHSPFGLTLVAALEQLESSAYSTLYSSSMKSRVAQAKAEIKTAKYLKGMLLGFRTEKLEVETMQSQLSEDDGLV